jgi:HAD superfamily hydrolase (TIGR01549 family)
MGIRAIYFDTSDTLYSSIAFAKAQEATAVHLVCEKLRLTESEAVSVMEEYRAVYQQVHNRPATKTALLAEFGIDRETFERAISALDPTKFLEPDPLLNDLLHRLSRTFQLGVITNTNEAAVQKTLAALGLDRELFSYFISADNAARPKPDPEPFLLATQMAHSVPKECVFVGDSLEKDMIPAKAVGMITVWIRGPHDVPGIVDERVQTLFELEERVRAMSASRT